MSPSSLERGGAEGEGGRVVVGDKGGGSGAVVGNGRGSGVAEEEAAAL